jgi:hypothetical protein
MPVAWQFRPPIYLMMRASKLDVLGIEKLHRSFFTSAANP